MKILAFDPGPATASALTWSAAGKPAHKYREEPIEGVCATCAAPISSGVPLRRIETPSMADHANNMRFYSQHVCAACAWLYALGRAKPGNYVATPGRMEYVVISLESVVESKRPWIEALGDLSRLPSDTIAAGVMTTDVKPRLWPRAKLTTIGRFGLYLHVPDYDISEFREFDLPGCLELAALMREPLAAGFAKQSLYHGLLRDYARTARDPSRAMRWDAALAPHRGQPHFLPALIAAGATKESNRDGKSPPPT